MEVPTQYFLVYDIWTVSFRRDFCGMSRNPAKLIYEMWTRQHVCHFIDVSFGEISGQKAQKNILADSHFTN